MTGSEKSAWNSLAECLSTAVELVEFAGWRHSDCFADSGRLFRRARKSPRDGWAQFWGVAVGVIEAVFAKAVVRGWFVLAAVSGMWRSG